LILRLSQNLAKKVDAGSLKPNPFADWSAHLFTADRAQYVIVTNTTSLYSVVMRGSGIASDTGQVGLGHKGGPNLTASLGDLRHPRPPDNVKAFSNAGLDSEDAMSSDYDFELESLKADILDRLSALATYAELMEKAVDSVIEGEWHQFNDERVEPAANAWQDAYPDMGAELFDDLYETTFGQDREVFTRFLPQTLRHSVLISCYSFLEQSLAKICKFYEERRPHDVKLSDLRHKGIFQAERYLSAVIHVPFPASAAPWQEILKYNVVRNWLVHTGPEVADGDNSSKLQNVVAQLHAIEIGEGGLVQLFPEACTSLVETIGKFLESLFAVLPHSRRELNSLSEHES